MAEDLVSRQQFEEAKAIEENAVIALDLLTTRPRDFVEKFNVLLKWHLQQRLGNDMRRKLNAIKRDIEINEEAWIIRWTQEYIERRDNDLARDIQNNQDQLKVT